MDIESLQDILIWKPTPIKQIVGGGILLEGSKLIFFGEPKTFKSLIIQQLAFCSSVGAPWLGFNTSMSRVLYIQGEISKFPFKLRIAQMSQNITVPPQNLFFSTNFNLKLDKHSGVLELEAALKRTQATFLILDPMYKMITASDESSIQRFVDNIDNIIATYNISVAIVHHSRKSHITQQGGVIDMGGAELRGPLFEQWADSIIRIRGNIDTDERTMTFELRHAVSLLPPISLLMDRKRLWFNRI